MELAHTKSVQEVLDYYGTDKERGLSIEQVKKNQEKYGPNGNTFFVWFDCSLTFAFILQNSLPKKVSIRLLLVSSFRLYSLFFVCL